MKLCILLQLLLKPTLLTWWKGEMMILFSIHCNERKVASQRHKSKIAETGEQAWQADWIKPHQLIIKGKELSASGSSHSRVCFSPLSRTNCWPTDSPVKLCLAGKLLNLLSNRTNAKVLNHQMCWTTQSTFSPVCLKLPQPSPLSKWCDRRKKKAENNPQCPPWHVTPPRSKL